MSKWFYINGIALIIIIFKIGQYPGFPHIPSHVGWGIVGVLLILFNWTRHAVFSTIRSADDRDRKIRFANFSKKVIPFHRWIGTAALLIIGIHAYVVTAAFSCPLNDIKSLSGVLAGLILLGMVISGWMRLIWPSGTKRMLHIYLGLALFFLILIHVLL